MRVLNKEELLQKKPTMLRELKKTVFIYPTDSIYGLGCDATNKELVQRVRDLKNSTLQSFSIIAPSKEWVIENCEIHDDVKEWIDKLGGLAEIDGEETTFSLVLKLKNKDAIAPNVNQGNGTISVRIPQHWFSEIVQEMDTPIITTSANPTGGNFMTSLEDLHEKIKSGVDYIIYTGEKKGKPSTLVYCDGDTVCVKKR